jgi:hypothetical protein
MNDSAEVQAIRDSVFLQDMRKLASEVKALTEYVRHIDVKLDILQGDLDELSTSLRLKERLAEVERNLETIPR